MEITEQYRKSVIESACKRIKELKQTYGISGRFIAEGLGFYNNIIYWIKDSKHHHLIPKKIIPILADFVNNKISFDGDKWKTLTVENGIIPSTEKEAMKVVDKIDDIKKEKALVSMSLDNTEMKKDLAIVEDELSLIDFWDHIKKAISVIPSNVSIEIKIN